MAKFLTLFNLLAGAASIAGLYVTIQTNYNAFLLIGLFGLALLLCIYVLFVPGTTVERNVTAKLWPNLAQYSNPNKSGEVEEIQHGEFEVAGFDTTAITFHRPFASAPQVEVIDTDRKGFVPIVQNVTAHQASFRRRESAPGIEKQFSYTWIARGVPLKRLSSEDG